MKEQISCFTLIFKIYIVLSTTAPNVNVRGFAVTNLFYMAMPA